MHENEVPFINGGEHIEWAPDIPIWSRWAIVSILAVTTILSLLKSRTMTPESSTITPARGTLTIIATSRNSPTRMNDSLTTDAD